MSKDNKIFIMSGWFHNNLPAYLKPPEKKPDVPFNPQYEMITKAEEIAKDISTKLKIQREPYSLSLLKRLLEQDYKAPHLFDLILKILQDKYNKRFTKIQRKRSRGR